MIVAEPVRRILIVRTSALGDVLHVLPSLAALRQLYPDAEISWIVEPLGASVLEGHPQIDRLLIIPRKRWKRDLRSPGNWPRTFREIRATVREMRGLRLDLVVDFQCNTRSGLAVAFSGARTRLGFHRDDCRELIGSLFTNLKAGRTEVLANKVVKNFRLVEALGWNGPIPDPVLAVPEADRDWAAEVIGKVRGSGPVISIHPTVSVFGALKRWPVEHFRALCRRLRRELDARLLLTWGPGEEELVASIDRDAVAPPTTRLLRLAALIEQSDVFVACDTGNLHLAAILRTPLVGLYGPKNPEIYAPFRHRGVVLKSRVPCSPCALRSCEHSICMSELAPETVFRGVIESLATAAPA